MEAIQYEWLKLDEEKKTLESAKDEKIISETQLSTFIEKGKAILSNPVELWHTSTRKQRLQLIKVRYGEDLYHCKNKGFRTTETAGFHQLFWTIVNTSFPSNTIDRSYFKLLDAIFHERNGSNLTLEEHVNLFFRLID